MGDTLTIDEQLFNIIVNLAKGQNVSPLLYMDMSFYKFCKFIDRLNRNNEYEESRYKNGMLCIRASDNWF